VLFTAGLVKNHPHEGAEAFIATLFSPQVQNGLGKYGLRPMDPAAAKTKGIDISGAQVVRFDWVHWAELEAALPRYEVQS
jgi:ABC-type sulfate transport system substrate-binding protein